MTHKLKKKKIGLIGLGVATAFAGVVGIGCINNNNVQQVRAIEEYLYTEDLSTVNSYLAAIYDEDPSVAPTNIHLKLKYDNNYITTYTVDYTAYEEINALLYKNNGISTIVFAPITDNFIYINRFEQPPLYDVQMVYIYQEGTNTTAYAELERMGQENGINKNTQPTSGTIGNDIITSVEGGLGLISSLATEFLSGFTTLFWNTTANTLTTFGIFALVMLGIAVSFAIVKLVLAILRSNTGA